MRSPNLSNTASNLSGFASLREASAIQFFTLRRQDAKEEAFQSKSTIPSLDLSGSASLRELSAIQDRQESEDAWPEPGVQAVGRVNDHSRDFILFHRAKLVLLLPACEAKNFSAMVFLRGTSSMQSQNESFSLRRQGAKKASKSKNPVSSLRLSGFASLREISARQGNEEFFTLRRQGAKKVSQSKSLVSSPDLSGFAPLREISVTQGRPAEEKR